MKNPVALFRFAFVGVALALSAQLARAEAGKAEVTSVSGTATINGAAAKRGDTATSGAAIVTGNHSSLDLFLDANGPNITVGEDTSITLDELSADTSGPAPVITTKINLKEGRISGYVKKSSDQSIYTVSTPSITAAVRGTKYMVSADGHLYVWEGCVDVLFLGGGSADDRFKNTHFQVCAGQAFDPNIPGVVPNTLPEPPIAVTPHATVPPVGPERPVSPIQPGTPVPTSPPGGG